MKKLAIMALAVLATAHLGWGQATSDSFSRIHLTPVSAQPISMSVDDVLSIKSLSNEQLTTLVNALNVTPTLPMTALPNSGLIGNFWSLQHPDWPPLPFDSSGAEAWPLTMAAAFCLTM